MLDPLSDSQTPTASASGDAACAFLEFETRLAGRTEVSAGQAQRLKALPESALSAEVRSAARIVQRFADAVSAAMQEPVTAVSFLAELDLRLVTRDHDWRAIFSELLTAGGGDGHRERVAIWNYLAYLCSRRDLLEKVLANRRSLEETDEFLAVRHRPEPAPGTRERLPKGLPVVLNIPYRGSLELHLGMHAFTIVDGYPPKLVEPDGRELRLAHGEQLVGRHPSCDLMVSGDYIEVSRGHMVVEWHGDSRLTVTDRSSMGTSVAASAIDSEQPLPSSTCHPQRPATVDVQAATRYCGPELEPT